MRQEEIERKINDAYKGIDMNSRIKAVETMIREAGVNDKVREINEQRLTELRDSVPREQLVEYRKNMALLRHNLQEEFLDIIKLETIAKDAKIIKLQEERILNGMYDMLISMKATRLAIEGKPVDELLLTVSRSPEMFLSGLMGDLEPGLEGCPDCAYYSFLASEIMEEEILSLPDKIAEKVEAIEDEIDSTQERAKLLELHSEMLKLLPLSEKLLGSSNAWDKVIAKEGELLNTLTEITRKYRPEYVAKIAGKRLTPELVYEAMKQIVPSTMEAKS